MRPDQLAAAQEFPEPLAPLTTAIITPENAALEEARKQARKLTRREFKQVVNALHIVEKRLQDADYPALRKQRNWLKADVRAICQRYAEDQLFSPTLVCEIGQRLITEKEALSLEWHAQAHTLNDWLTVVRALRDVHPLIEDYKFLQKRIKSHYLAYERERLENAEQTRLHQEAKEYEQIIIRTWRRLGYYEKITGKRGKVHVKAPQFGDITYTLDAHYMEIDASYRTAFGGWNTGVPEGVTVRHHLIGEQTLDELSIACRRQVTAQYNPRDPSTGVYVVVNRLRAPDGLMDYVTFDAAMDYYPDALHDKLPICVGVSQNRKVEWICISQFPHWLIGGSTGAGKSNMVNVIISTLISRHSPEEVRLVLIDLKGGMEFSYYGGIPHLHGKIVEHDLAEVEAMLSEIKGVMQVRFSKFRGIARSLDEYRAKRPKEYMPSLVIVFDEVANIMESSATKDILTHLREIARLGRAVGIHLILCTQRPDVEAVSGNIKINLAVRLSGAMPTAADSLTILGNAAAKDLAPIAGRMVLQLGNLPKPVQTPHLTEDAFAEAMQIALAYDPAPALDVPELAEKVYWTPEKVIELALKHLDGKITAKAVYDNAEGVTQAQARQLVEQIWAMECIPFEDKQYRVERGRSNVRKLVEISEA